MLVLPSVGQGLAFRRFLAGIVACALLLGLWGCWWGSPYPLHPDTPRLVEDAWRLATTGQTAVSGHMYGWLPRMIYAGALAPLALIFPHEPATRVPDMAAPFWAYVVARSVNALLSAGLVLVVGLLGARLLGPAGGLLAAGALAVSFLRVRECHWASPDTPQTLFIWLTIALTVRAFDGRGTWKEWALAGAGAGAAAACRLPTGMVVLTPLFAASLRPPASEQPGPRRRARWGWVLAGAAGAFVVTDYGVLLEPAKLVLAMAGEAGKHEGAGAFAARLGVAHYFLGQTPAGGVGPLMLLAAAVGLVAWLLGEHRRWMPILLSFVIPFLLFIGLTGQPSRWFLPVVPFVALSLGGLCLHGLRGGMGRGVAAALVLVAFGVSLVECVRADYWMSVPNTRALAAQWIDRNLPAGTTVATYETGWWHLVGPFDRTRLRKVSFPEVPFPTARGRAEALLEAASSPLFRRVVAHLGARLQERLARRVAEARRTLERDYAPGRDRPAPLSYYQAAGVQYVITSSLGRDQWLNLRTTEETLRATSWLAFYAQLDRECRRVAVFSAPPGAKRCWPLSFAEHPEVIIYQVPPAPAGGSPRP